MSECKGCGTKLKNCGAPIWEDYCPNKECHYEAEQFKSRMRKAGEDMRKKKALEAAAPELYEALESSLKILEHHHSLWMNGLKEDILKSRSALAKARGEV